MRKRLISSIFMLSLFLLFLSCSSNSNNSNKQKTQKVEKEQTIVKELTIPSAEEDSAVTKTTSSSTTTTTTTSSSYQENYLDAKVGDEIIIDLEENPTTGYSWQYYITEGAQSIFHISDNYKQDEEATKLGLLGAGGIHRFVFSCRKEDKVIITFDYLRPWEDESIDRRLYHINISK